MALLLEEVQKKDAEESRRTSSQRTARARRA